MLLHGNNEEIFDLATADDVFGKFFSIHCRDALKIVLCSFRIPFNRFRIMFAHQLMINSNFMLKSRWQPIDFGAIMQPPPFEKFPSQSAVDSRCSQLLYTDLKATYAGYVLFLSRVHSFDCILFHFDCQYVSFLHNQCEVSYVQKI